MRVVLEKFVSRPAGSRLVVAPGLWLGLLLGLGLGACYQQPAIPRDKPLRCTSQQEGQCPVGFRCTASGLCANINCETDEQCPLGLVCTDRTGCDVPATNGRDGGADAAGDALPDGGLLPGGVDGPGGAELGGGADGSSADIGLPDAPAGLDAATSFDLGGNS